MGLLDTSLAQSDYYAGGGNGNYQFTSLDNVINQFIIAYVGEDKVISKVKRTDVAFHAQRAMQELSFDTFKSCKAQEIVVPASLQMILPQDYVNYTKISWVDSAGIKHLMYPTSKTSNPNLIPYQDEDGNYSITPIATLTNNSNIIVLDGDYSGVLIHGMRADGPNLKPASYIHDITTTSGITSITLKNKGGTNVKNATATTNQEISIFRFSYLGSAMLKAGQSSIETTIAATQTAGVGSDTITVASTTGIEKGMFINHPAYTTANVTKAIHVIGVGTTTVTLSGLADFNVTNGTAVAFVSDDEFSKTWENYKSTTPSENNNDDYEDDTYWPLDGSRYGLDPQHAQVNGSFYIDCHTNKVHFSSNVSGKTVILDYISDSLGTNGEMQVHKFAEEAMYKWIAYAILSTRANVQEYIVQRYKKERFAEIRKAKLRLSNIKLEEITQILRGKSKQIKH